MFKVIRLESGIFETTVPLLSSSTLVGASSGAAIEIEISIEPLVWKLVDGETRAMLRRGVGLGPDELQPKYGMKNSIRVHKCR